MLKKFYKKLYQWSAGRLMKEQTQQKLTTQEKARKQMHGQLESLYSFVVWLNTKGLNNRRQRKLFWRNAASGQPVVENVLKHLIETYEAQEKAKNEAKKK